MKKSNYKNKNLPLVYACTAWALAFLLLVLFL